MKKKKAYATHTQARRSPRKIQRVKMIFITPRSFFIDPPKVRAREREREIEKMGTKNYIIIMMMISGGETG